MENRNFQKKRNLVTNPCLELITFRLQYFFRGTRLEPYQSLMFQLRIDEAISKSIGPNQSYGPKRAITLDFFCSSEISLRRPGGGKGCLYDPRYNEGIVSTNYIGERRNCNTRPTLKK